MLLETPPNAVLSRQSATRRLLLVAYNFPPVGGAGVQRPVKWVKYLGQFGWDVTVLTTRNPSVPVRDESLLSELPDNVDIVRAKTWEPGYSVKKTLISPESAAPGLAKRFKHSVRNFAKRCVKLALQPDPQVLWNPDAIRVGSRALKSRQHDAILVTAPAFSSFLIGESLKRRFGLPLILDYRDEWDLSGQYLENAQRDWFSRTVQTRMQNRLLRRADAVIATTGRSAEALREKLLKLGRTTPSHCIYNGFDAEDFAEPDRPTASEQVASAESGTFRLVYTGTLWNLTDITPLVAGIEALARERPELARRLELVCVGRKTPEQQAVLQRLTNTSARLVDVGYCDHAAALQWLRSAQGLCLLLSDVPGAERVVPAKLFEYLATGKDMLAICPAGEAAEIAGRFVSDGPFLPAQVSSIAKWLQQRLERNPVVCDHQHACREFSRQSQTERLAKVLDSLVVRQ